MSGKGDMLLPSKLPEAKQHWILSPNLAVETRVERNGMELESHVSLDIRDNTPFLDITANGRCPGGGWVVVALRPYNAEGIQFIEKVRFEKSSPGWVANFNQPPEKVFFSNYDDGDVIHHLNKPGGGQEISCKVGMATAAALFPIPQTDSRSVQVNISLEKDLPKNPFAPRPWSVRSLNRGKRFSAMWRL